MDQEPIFQPSAAIAQHAHVDKKGYEELYSASIADPDAFWAERQENRLDFVYSQISDVSWYTIFIKWYADMQLTRRRTVSTGIWLNAVSNRHYLGGR